jgi:hypothetical protein
MLGNRRIQQKRIASAEWDQPNTHKTELTLE